MTARGANGERDAESLSELLRYRCEARPDTRFVKCPGSTDLTHGELDARVAAVSAGLVERVGVERGSRVAVLSPNRIEVVELMFALGRLGAIQVPLNSWLRGEFLRYQLADSGAAVLVTDAAGLAIALPCLTGTSVSRIVVLEPVECPTDLAVVEYSELRAAAPMAATRLPAAGDAAAIMYTSGTTGLPKGCVLPHGYFVQAAASYVRAEWIVADDRVFTAFPLFHASGQVLILSSVLRAGASVCFDEHFSASRFMPRARAERATMVWGVGAMGRAILAQPESDADHDPHLRLAAWVPITPEEQLRFERRFGPPVICESYGQTECNPITVSRVSGPRRRDNAGMINPDYEVAVVNSADAALPVGAVGEIVARPRHPAQLCSGYWGRPEDTIASRSNLWHHTGDLGRLEADGSLTFVDRKSDSMRRRGENVSAFELERAIGLHEAIEQVAACAVPSPLGEDDIKVSVVLHAHATLKPAAFFEFLRRELPYFAVPRYVDVRASMPTNALGRIMKAALRDEGVGPSTWDFEAMGLTVAAADRRR